MLFSPSSSDEVADSPLPLPQRIFLDWSTPLLPQLTDWFLPQDDAQPWFDLSGHLFIAPTRESGRRLRESLAKAAALRGKGLLSPTVVTPEAFFTLISPALPLAGEITRLAVWHDVLREQPAESLPRLFPKEIPRHQEAGNPLVLNTAKTLFELQKTLGLGGLTIQETRQLLLSYLGEGERERWQELVRLESAYFKSLARLGVHDPQRVQRQAADDPRLPPHVRSIHLLALADPPFLLEAACTRVLQHVPVQVFVFADSALQDQFDAWGRPLIESWGTAAKLRLPLPRQRVHPLENPEQEAAWLAQTAAKRPESRVLGVGNPELIPRLQSLLQSKDLRLYVPDGIPAASHPLVQWLERLADFVASGSWSSLQKLVRATGMTEYFARGIPGLSRPGLLKILDQFQRQRLPSSLEAALVLAATPCPLDEAEPDFVVQQREFLTIMLKRAHEVRQQFLRGALPAALPHFFNEVFGSSMKNSAFQPKYPQWMEAGTAVRNLLTQFTVKPAKTWPLRAQFRALQLMLADLRLSNPRELSDHEAWGWLELLWLEQQPLAVAGVNEGLIPTQVTQDPFLPGSVRDPLHPRLPSNEQRFARDAYLFMALLRSHPQCEVSFSRVTNEGDLLRPSRFLFLCEPAALPQRVEYFLKPAEAPRHLFPAKKNELVLRNPWPEVDTDKALTLSPSKLREYLSCPFRYYLRNVLKMKQIEAQKNEFDSMDFGNLCHEALRRFGEDPAVRDSQDEREIADFLEREAALFVEQLCGGKPPAAVMLQVEAARQRLRAFAREQARQRRGGWKISKVETPVLYPMGEVTIDGRIDRIDAHDDHGLMIIDYKTSNKASSPLEAHLSGKRIKDAVQRHPWKTVDFQDNRKNKSVRLHWTDLQLPLYYHALRLEHANRTVAASYFNLPLSNHDCGVNPWHPMDHNLMLAAEACAREVIDRIRSHQFWPPGKAEYDDYQHILPGLSMMKGKSKIDCEFDVTSESAGP